MITRRNLFLTILMAILGIVVGPGVEAEAQSTVRVWEGSLVIPTYQIGPPDPHPLFYSGRIYQGVKGAVYPYAMLDKVTDTREDKNYLAAYLENEYIKICVLPEIGGRVLSAQDKTNGYDFFYHQHVIKPALIGVLGAWISGGMEWNFPHVHRATTFMPVDHVLKENADGSKTIWVGETEIRHRMRWVVGLTVYPGKSYVEATVRLVNSTPYAQSFAYWANAAVSANEDYQVIFPPDTQIATFHAKNEFLRWPISDRDFLGVEFGKPVDVSWWKNHPSYSSWFAVGSQGDFFGGYDHGKHAGVIHVADHHVAPGKKFWLWGNSAFGRTWEKILTDSDGPYIELMGGGYSDNQPDYTWIQPYEVKTVKQYWYPIREMGGVKNANLDAAVNLEVKAGHIAHIAFNTTSQVRNARVLLEAGGRSLFEQQTEVAPDKPYSRDILLPAGVKEEDLKVSLFSSDHRALISWTPLKLVPPPLPEAVKAPPPPKDVQTVDELYRIGLRLQQFYNPVLEPYPYYEEALRRDPGDYQVNTKLGILYCQRGMYELAEQKLRTALARATHDFTTPQDGEAFYYLGLALEGQEKYEAAYDAFFKATWSGAWRSAGYYHLGRIACRKGEYVKALGHLAESLSSNAQNANAISLEAAVQRHLGHFDSAAHLSASVLARDPLDFWAGNEAYLAQLGPPRAHGEPKALASLRIKMRDNPQSYLELAVNYGDSGLWKEAIDVLLRLTGPDHPPATLYPMIYYYIGYYSEMGGDSAQAARYYRLAAKMPPDYCFPFRLESVGVLHHALASNPQDARAHYYLGNLFYNLQPAAAVKEWEASRDLDGSYAMVHRNLALAYAQQENNLPKAIASLEKAIERDPKDARFFYEMDRLCERAGVPPAQRLARLESHQQIVLERDDALEQEITLLVELGQYDHALGLLNHHFHAWEGGGEIHAVYADAHLLKGRQEFRSKRFREALEDYEAARAYPDNLEAGRPYRDPRDVEIYYFIATAQQALGSGAQARDFYEKCVSEEVPVAEMRYYQALAYHQLGQDAQAGAIYQTLAKLGKAELEATSGVDYFSKFGEREGGAQRLAHAYYLLGLAALGQGKTAEAKSAFQQALREDTNHLGARIELSALN
jgi:tetratricopeptide (TPR) repeat protein